MISAFTNYWVCSSERGDLRFECSDNCFNAGLRAVLYETTIMLLRIYRKLRRFRIELVSREHTHIVSSTFNRRSFVLKSN